MILITGLVICSALFGFGGGGVAALIMFYYTLYFFSTNHSLVEFNGPNLQKVLVSFAGIMVDMFLVCALKQTEVRAFKEVDALAAKLKEENELLHSISFSDALTGVQNRMSLKRDYDTFMDKEVTVMMVDLDRFKIINDTCGHKEGDRVLKETGFLLADTFGRERCYRYGGDEFIIIASDIPEQECRQRIDGMMSKRPSIALNGAEEPVGYSVGFAHETVSETMKLRDLFAIADHDMYVNKRARKQAEGTQAERTLDEGRDAVRA